MNMKIPLNQKSTRHLGSILWSAFNPAARLRIVAMVNKLEDIPDFDVVRKGNHAYCLPDTQANTRSNATVKTLEAVITIDVSKRVSYRQFRRSICRSALRHRLHLQTFNELFMDRSPRYTYFDSHNLDGLIPCGQCTAWMVSVNHAEDHRFHKHAPIDELKILSMAASCSPSFLPRAERIQLSANRANPMLQRRNQWMHGT